MESKKSKIKFKLKNLNVQEYNETVLMTFIRIEYKINNI